MSTKLDSALALAARGFRVFPLDINGKEPACTWRETATSDPERIKALWTDPVFDVQLDYNVGIAPANDLIVVDVDVRDGKQGEASLKLLETLHDDLPPTFTVETATGGRHLYFKTDRDSATFPAKLATDIDLKGGNGFVVGPGSTIDGRPYRAREEGGGSEIAMAPGWLRDLPVAKRRDRGERVGTEGLAELNQPAAVERAIAWLHDAPGSGTFRTAARVKDFGISEEKCLELMLEHWPGSDTREEEHIAFRVENAYRYGQNAPGISSPELEFEAVDIPEVGIPTTEKQPRKRGLYVVRWDDARPILDRPYLIDDMIDAGAMVVTYGDSNVGKTYVVLDQARCVASGTEWNGHKVKQGLVVYAAPEGGTGFHKRIEAYKREYNLSALPFSLVPCPIDLHALGDSGDTDRLIRLVRAEEAHFGIPCVLIVIDTLARAMGGGDENTSVDMGLLVRHCDRLRAATGAAVNLIHHTGKDKSKGARGSSALRAATDTEIEVDDGVVSVQKQRDMAKADPMYFALKTVQIGQRADGREVTACVVEWKTAAEFEDKVTPEAMKLLGVLKQLAGDAEPDAFVPWADWWGAASVVLKGARGNRMGRNHMTPLRHQLEHAGLVEKSGDKKGAGWRITDKADSFEG